MSSHLSLFPVIEWMHRIEYTHANTTIQVHCLLQYLLWVNRSISLQFPCFIFLSIFLLFFIILHLSHSTQTHRHTHAHTHTHSLSAWYLNLVYENRFYMSSSGKCKSYINMALWGHFGQSQLQRAIWGLRLGFKVKVRIRFKYRLG